MLIVKFLEDRVAEENAGHEEGRCSPESCPGLRRAKSDLAIMADHMLVVRHDGDTVTVIGCVRCSVSDYDLARPDPPPDLTGPCPTLRHLAASWSDHPDYDPAWLPA